MGYLSYYQQIEQFKSQRAQLAKNIETTNSWTGAASQTELELALD